MIEYQDKIEEKSYDGMFYILYKTVNIVNGKEYIGIHKTTDINDGYIGNGVKNQVTADYKNNTPFKRAVKKYGYDNFKRTILKFCRNYKELEEEEAKLVTYEYINQKNTYNAQIGGRGANINSPLKYDLKDSEGTRYKGTGITVFCNLKGLSNKGISDLMRGDMQVSQNYCRSDKYEENLIIIVNLETHEVFKALNLRTWCSKNAPELNTRKGGNKLNDILRNRAKVANKKWWACRFKDWKGIEELIKNDPRIKNYLLIDKNNNIHHVDNVRYFCKLYGILESSLYQLLSGKTNSCRDFKLYKE